MITLTVFLFCITVALGIGLLAGWSDVKGMTIPNIYSALIAGAFVLCYAGTALAGAGVFYSLFSHVLAGFLVFAVTAALFFARAMGAADSKLASAYALWLGLPGLVPFLFYTAAAGGILGIAALLIRKYKPFRNPPEGSWIAQLQAGASKVPYGVAIVFGSFVSFGLLGYFGGETFLSFLTPP